MYIFSVCKPTIQTEPLCIQTNNSEQLHFSTHLSFRRGHIYPRCPVLCPPTQDEKPISELVCICIGRVKALKFSLFQLTHWMRLNHVFLSVTLRF